MNRQAETREREATTLNSTPTAMVSSKLNAVAGIGTQTHEDTLAYRRWQHEDARTSLERVRRAQTRHIDVGIVLLVSLLATFVTLFLTSLAIPKAKADSSIEGVRVTTYKSSSWETDGDPSHGASGKIVTDGMIAVSRDLLWRSGGPFHWGDRIKLTDPDGPPACNRTYVVEDTMAKRWRKRVDIFLPNRVAYFSCYSVTIEQIPSG